ncbi:MAG TPA: hypothetical protein VGL45_12395 [Bradyrhizobium sp.]|jgi:hypothetical protein|nr:hypothetical protein [Pseudolabrys sp.]
MAEAPGFDADRRFDHAANDSPRSGSSKRVTPVMWTIVVIAIVALAIWFAAGR